MPLLAAAAAVGIVVHILNPHEDRERERSRQPTERPDSSAGATVPDAKELAGIVRNDPDRVARMVAGALPRGEKDSQRFEVLEIRALVTQGKVGAARARAEAYYARWPAGPDIATLEQLTGAHPVP